MLASVVFAQLGCSADRIAFPGDGTFDDMADAGPACAWGWQPTNFDPCDPMIPSPTEALVLPAEASPWASYVYDTDDGTLLWPDTTVTAPTSALVSQAGGAPIRVISLTTLDIGHNAKIVLTGSHPVLFAVNGSARIDGWLDASAFFEMGPYSISGPGADNAAHCASSWGGNGTDATTSAGAGGGGGGAYGGDGGDGGDGNGTGHGSRGAKGIAAGDATISPLRGGCGGGDGAIAATTMATAGPAGRGGGGLEVSVRGTLIVTGRVTSVGEAGRAGMQGYTGGGGGGSGGAILLEAELVTIELSAILSANGGSGGEGWGSSSAGADGAPGSFSETAAATTPDQSTTGGNGGNGGYVPAPAGLNAGTGVSGGAGGGGGGGVGRIRIRGTTLDVDPAATITPNPEL